MRKHCGILSAFLAVCCIGALAMLQAGCERAEPVTYRIPKEERPAEVRRVPSASEAESAPVTMGALAFGEAPSLRGGQQTVGRNAGEIHYSAPNGWKELPAPGMRRANFEVGDNGASAEVTVLAYSGDAGGHVD